MLRLPGHWALASVRDDVASGGTSSQARLYLCHLTRVRVLFAFVSDVPAPVEMVAVGHGGSCMWCVDMYMLTLRWVRHSCLQQLLRFVGSDSERMGRIERVHGHAVMPCARA